MAITVSVPGALQAYAGGARVVRLHRPCSTVRDALRALGVQCPGVVDRVLTEQGAVRDHVNLFVGEESIRLLGGLDASVCDGDAIEIIAAVSGG